MRKYLLTGFDSEQYNELHSFQLMSSRESHHNIQLFFMGEVAYVISLLLRSFFSHWLLPQGSARCFDVRVTLVRQEFTAS